AEGIEVCGVQVGNEQHVGSFDALPARDGRTVESLAAFQLVFIDGRGGHRHVMLTTRSVGEAEINKLDFLVGDLFQDVFRACHVISIDKSAAVYAVPAGTYPNKARCMPRPNSGHELRY